MADRVKAFIDAAIERNKHKTGLELLHFESIMELYADILLKGTKYISQLNYLKKRLAEIDPTYKQVDELVKKKRRQLKLNN